MGTGRRRAGLFVCLDLGRRMPQTQTIAAGRSCNREAIAGCSTRWRPFPYRRCSGFICGVMGPDTRCSRRAQSQSITHS